MVKRYHATDAVDFWKAMKLRELHKSLIYMCLIRIATIAFLLPQCMGVSWIPDTVSSSISTTTTVNSTTLTLRYSANGVIDSNEGGHFRVQLSARDQNSLSYNGITDCLAIGSSAAEVESAIQTTSLLTDITLPDSTVHRTSSSPTSPTKLFSVAVKRLYEDAFSTSSNTYIIQFENRTPLTSVEISVNTTGCINPRTVGLWSDGTKWDTGAVPSANDDVVIPFGSGIVVLTSDVTVSSFTQISGNLVGIDTSCPHGWSVSFRGQAA